MKQLSRMTLFALFCGLQASCFNSEGDDDDDDDEEDSEPVDSDGDGLTDDEEEALGLDPNSDDSDGDGFTDAEEIEVGTNPLYEYSHSYTGDYNVGYCENGMASATGPSSSNGSTDMYAEGDVVENFTLMDRYGEDVDLYSFCGQYVMLVFGASWCGPCVSFSEEVQAIQDEYDNVQILEILIEDDYGDPPDQGVLEDWADHGEFTSVAALADGDYSVWPYFEADWGIPSTTHIGPDGTVLSVDEYVTDPGQFMD